MFRCFTLVSLLFLLIAAPARAQEAEAPRNVIFLIADGFGPASATMAREFQGAPLVLDSVLTGTVRTASSSSRVTDSAAGATAYASGIKTYNGAIGVDSLQRPVGTVLEAAEARGLATGLVATSRITHATPAAYAAHVPYRGAEEQIAAQMMEQGVEVLLGGGRRFFVPEADGGLRTDGRDLLAEARERGYTLITTPEELRTVEAAPVLGLFSPDHLAYEIDRVPAAEPGLADLTRRALDLLADYPDGFFLMVEGSRIDHAAHGNDPAAHLHDILAYDAAVAVALEFARAHPNTLVVSVSDHETGGMTLGRDGIYAWDPDYLGRVRASIDVLAARIAAGEAPQTVLREYAALDSLSAADLERIEQAGIGAGAPSLYQTLAELVSERAVVGWTTGGHTGVDINLYAYGPGSERLRGVMQNDAVGRTVAELLGLDLAAVTARLRQSTGAGAAGATR